MDEKLMIRRMKDYEARLEELEANAAPENVRKRISLLCILTGKTEFHVKGFGDFGLTAVDSLPEERLPTVYADLKEMYAKDNN